MFQSGAWILLTVLGGSDPFRATYLENEVKYRKSPLTVAALSQLQTSAFTSTATPRDRFALLSAIVINRNHPAIGGEKIDSIAGRAKKCVKESDALLSPVYGYVVACVGILSGSTSQREIAAAKLYQEKGNAENGEEILARAYANCDVYQERAKSLPWALRAQQRQKDSGAIRWLVAGGYYYAASNSGSKADWKTAYEKYLLAIPLLKGNDKKIANHYLGLAKKNSGL